MIDLEQVTIQSGPFSLTGISLSVPQGTYAVLMGGTGQGKTTILEAICGLRPVTKGRVLLDGEDITRWKPADRGIGYVPQDLALFPQMSVRQHLEFALKLRRAPAKLIEERVSELADVLGIASLLARQIHKLSGGEAQRVALGRALAFRPRVLLLDEPLAALDEATRDRLCDLLQSIQKLGWLTVLHITHSRSEAQRLAQKLFLIENRQVSERPLSLLQTLSFTADASSPASLQPAAAGKESVT